MAEGKDLVLPKLVKGEDGHLSLLAFESLQRDQSGWQRSTAGQFVMFKKDVNGSWSPPTTMGKLSGTKANIGMAVGSTIKMFWKDHRIQLIFGAYDVGAIGSIYEMTQSTNGSWPETTLIATSAVGKFQVWSQGNNSQKIVFWTTWDGTSSTIMSAQQTVSGWTKPSVLIGLIKDRHVRLLTLAPTPDSVSMLWDEGKAPISVLKTTVGRH